MKVISPRVSIINKNDLYSLVILPTADKKKLSLLFLWLFAWTLCGVVVFANYFKIQEQNAKMFIIVYLSFWAYFEYRIASAFVWKKFGKEKLWIQNGVLYYQREINNRGKIKDFSLHLITNLKEIELNTTGFAFSLSQSFWIKGGERLEFSSQAKTIRFGMQINEDEKTAVLQSLNPFFK
jgi:hypothetical protein